MAKVMHKNIPLRKPPTSTDKVIFGPSRGPVKFENSIPAHLANRVVHLPAPTVNDGAE
jgi:hypothetical protein